MLSILNIVEKYHMFPKFHLLKPNGAGSLFHGILVFFVMDVFFGVPVVSEAVRRGWFNFTTNILSQTRKFNQTRRLSMVDLQSYPLTLE